MTFARDSGLFLAALLVAVSATMASATDSPRTFPLVLHPVAGVSPEFAQARLEVANALFAPARVRFEVARTETLDPAHANLITPDDRDALGAYRSRDGIDVFVVDSLMDVDAPPRMRRGVHWRDRTRPGIRYLIVIASSSESVLAHELGHYFGLGHSDVTDNLMSYSRSGGPPFLDDAQIARIGASARRLARIIPQPERRGTANRR